MATAIAAVAAIGGFVGTASYEFGGRINLPELNIPNDLTASAGKGLLNGATNALGRFTPEIFKFEDVNHNWRAVGLEGASVGFISYASGVPVPIGVFFELEVGVPKINYQGLFTLELAKILPASAANKAGQGALKNKSLFRAQLGESLVARKFAERMQYHLNKTIKGARVNTPIITPNIRIVNAITGKIIF